MYRDINGNGQIDEADEPIDGAVVILDGGARSERVRQGQFRFDAVRCGSRMVRLLAESLPEGAVITGEPEGSAPLTRDHMTAAVQFLVSIEKRPEIRRVFPPRGGTTTAARVGRGAGTTTAKPAAGRPGTAPASRVSSAPTRAAAPPLGRFVVQVGAFHNPETAAALVATLKSAGLPAYITHPGPADPSPYRIRVGPFTSHDAAQTAARALEQERGEKYWVTRER